MGEQLDRLESAVTASASGNLSWERWTHDYAVAIGLSGQRNPLGFAVVRYLSDEPSSSSMWGVVLVLANEMEKRGEPAERIKEKAFEAFDWWRDMHCTACSGRGVSAHGMQCSACAGTGDKAVPSAPAHMSLGVQCLLDAQSWMERQLQARMRRGE